jgi:hypothetical protein
MDVVTQHYNTSFLYNNTYICVPSQTLSGPSGLWLYGSWIYNYLCNQCLSPLTLWVRIPLERGLLDTTLCDKVCQWLAAGRWISPGTPGSSTNKTEILLVALNANTLTPSWTSHFHGQLKIKIWSFVEVFSLIYHRKHAHSANLL